jgi:hypothetical protein
MLKRLQDKWKVNGTQLLLILCTFAIGGSTTGYITRKLFKFAIPLEPGILKSVLYVLVITLLWPFVVI